MTLRVALAGLALAALFAGGPAGSAVAEEAAAKGIAVANAWSRATPGGAKVGAAFMEITAAAGADDVLVAAASPAAAVVEIHTHSMDDGVMKMRKLDKLPIAAGSAVVLKPGGLHIMLIDLKAPLKENDSVPLTLTFEKAGAVAVEAKVGPVGAKGPDGGAAKSDKDGGSGDHTGHGQH